MTDVNRLDRLCRYCRPGNVLDDMPRTNAFLMRASEKYLSVNILPGDLDVEAGLARINKILGAKEYDTSPNGKFAVFSAGRMISYVRELGNVDIRIECKPSSDDPTHAGIVLAGRHDANARDRLTRTMARAMATFFRKNPDSIYPVR